MGGLTITDAAMPSDVEETQENSANRKLNTKMVNFGYTLVDLDTHMQHLINQYPCRVYIKAGESLDSAEVYYLAEEDNKVLTYKKYVENSGYATKFISLYYFVNGGLIEDSHFKNSIEFHEFKRVLEDTYGKFVSRRGAINIEEIQGTFRQFNGILSNRANFKAFRWRLLSKYAFYIES